MRRLLPRSLLGQMLLAVALALLVAQTISVVLRYRAEERQIEFGLVNELAFQLVADPRIEFATHGEAREGRGNRRERRRLRIQRALESPLMRGELRDAGREQALRGVLEAQGIAIGELVVLSREISRDRYIMDSLQRDGRFLRQRWDPHAELVLAGLKRAGEEQWLIARAPRPERAPGTMVGIIVQTVILYIALVGGMALLLRRITRPLAALTRRVEQFGGSLGREPPLEPTGPADARRLITAHNAMEARIAALLDEKDVMLGAIGHDLKTPLAALRVRIESVEDDAERGRMAATIEDITTSLDDILSLARVGRPSDPLERTDLTALVASVVEEFEDMEENVELGETQRIALPLRTTWLRRALRNLIGNALRYAGKAEVSLSREPTADGGEEAVIRILDHGPGIPEAEIAAMLEPFARGEGSRNRETGGAGLGLTLARAIAEQHGGTLELSNRYGLDGKANGLLAEIKLPIGR